MAWSTPQTFTGKHCRLVPLSMEHLDELMVAVQDGELWKLWYTLIPAPQQMKNEITRRLNLQQQGTMLPFTIFSVANNKIIGMTTYLNMDENNKRLEIGGTWLSKSVQRTAINTEAKFLLLTHAFETLNCNAVELRTHFMNRPSRRSIERLGTKLDGILRHHMIMPDGTLRDTCVYSILKSEWPTVKKSLQWRLGLVDGDVNREK